MLKFDFPKLEKLFDLIVIIGAAIIPGVTLSIYFPELFPSTDSDLRFILYSIAYSLPFFLSGIYTAALYRYNVPIVLFLIGSMATFYTFFAMEHFKIFISNAEGIYIWCGAYIVLLWIWPFVNAYLESRKKKTKKKSKHPVSKPKKKKPRRSKPKRTKIS